MRRTALVAFALLMLVSGCVSPPPASAPPPLQPAPPPDLPPIDSQPAFGEAIFVTTLSRNVDPARLGRSPIPAEEPLLAADARGTIYVALPITRALFHSDDGQSFVSLWDSRESREEGLAGINDASLLADDDVLYWAGLDFRGGVAEQGFVPFQRSEDRGATWSPPGPGTRPGHSPSPALDRTQSADGGTLGSGDGLPRPFADFFGRRWRDLVTRCHDPRGDPPWTGRRGGNLVRRSILGSADRRGPRCDSRVRRSLDDKGRDAGVTL